LQYTDFLNWKGRDKNEKKKGEAGPIFRFTVREGERGKRVTRTITCRPDNNAGRSLIKREEKEGIVDGAQR